MLVFRKKMTENYNEDKKSDMKSRTPSLPPIVTPSVPPDSATLTLAPPPPRMNVLRPETPNKRTVAMETEEAHWRNQERTRSMQTRQQQNFHEQWARPVYGSPVSQESYRKHIRDTLKFQMDEREKQWRQTSRYKIHETELALHNDNQSRVIDSAAKRQKLEYLKQFRDENKRLMEVREQQKKIQVVIDHGREREILRYNPINWSCSLK